MFGNWFGEFGNFGRVGKAAAKKRTLAKKAGKAKAKGPRFPQTRKVPPRKYPRRRLPWVTPEAVATYRAPPMGPAVPAGRGITIGKPTPHTQRICGCKVVRMKNKREAIKCPGGPTGKGMFRFAKAAELTRAKAAGTVCTHVPIFGAQRGPLSLGEKAKRAAKRAYAFKTSRGNVVAFKQRPSWRHLKRNVALYYHMLDKRAKARGAKLRYMPSFADINGAYGDYSDGWGG